MLQEAKNDSSYTDEQRQLYKDRLDDLNTEKQARLEIVSQKPGGPSNIGCKNQADT